MTEYKPHFFEIEIVETIGAFGPITEHGRPIFFCWIAGSVVGTANIVILSYEWNKDLQVSVWNEYRHKLDQNEKKEIIESLRQLGIPERLPDVREAINTADFWNKLSIKLAFDNKRFYLDVSRFWTGNDAEKLSSLIDYLKYLAKLSPLNEEN